MFRFSRSAKRRRATIARLIPTPGRILEFGPFDNPTFHRSHGDQVDYLDFSSADELRRLASNSPNRNPDRIDDVAFVVKSKHFAASVDSLFDLAVANHVLEHVPDPITWFFNLKQVLRPDGHVFLALPDRRYTFDYFRPESTATALVEAYELDLERAPMWQVAEAVYYHSEVDVHDRWRTGAEPVFSPRFSLEQAVEIARDKSKTYSGVHCWVFTAESFERCVASLQTSGLFDFRIDSLKGPISGTREFHVVLRPN